MRDDRGFAIPMVVLLVALITVMLTSGFVRVRADRQVAESQEASSEALSVARSGLHLFLEAQSARPDDGFTDTMYVTGGYAIVTATIVQNPADPEASQTWIVRSTGYVIDAGTGSTPRAQRTVAQFAEWQTASLRAVGAITIPNGLLRNRYGRVEIDGNDDCTANSIPGLRTAGIVGAPNSSFYTYGSPGTLDQGSSAGAALADTTYVDWLDVLAGGIRPDFTTPQNGNMSDAITLVTGNYTTSGGFSGKGLLIVTGNLRTTSWFYWWGIILVGGKAEFDGRRTRISGQVITGLNEQLRTGNPPQTELGQPNPSQSSYHTYIYYDSCDVQDALGNLTGFAPIDNAFVDNWATY